MKIITITSKFITLGQFLKFTGIVNSGAFVKQYLLNNNVFVNDVLDNRRGRKLYSNDYIKIDNIIYQIYSASIELE